MLSHHEQIIFAFIFGSILFGSILDLDTPGGHGDIDLAVYFDHVEDGKEHVYSSKIEVEIFEHLDRSGLNVLPVEVLVLNHAPAHLQVQLLKQPYTLVKENEEIFTDFIEAAGSRAMANHYFRNESIRELLEG